MLLGNKLLRLYLQDGSYFIIKFINTNRHYIPSAILLGKTNRKVTDHDCPQIEIKRIRSIVTRLRVFVLLPKF